MNTCISPIDGSTYAERPYPSSAEIEAALKRAAAAACDWRAVPLDERARYCRALVEAFKAKTDRITEELAWQMGRPVRYGPKEVGGFEERATCMIDMAADALGDIELPDRPNQWRRIRREPLGVVFTIAPWNYPYLTAVNSIVPALMAGNSVVLKQSHQTLLCAERMVEAGAEAGLPDGLFQFLHTSHEQTAAIIASPEIAGVAFTGSVAGGEAVERAAAGRFIPVGLELGGKDAALVRPDIDIQYAAENLVDGAFFNSGQSCCGIERIYCHADVYDAFVEAYVATTNEYVLGSPLDPNTTLGPMVRRSAAEFVRGQIEEGVAAGAKALIDPARFPAHDEATAYMAPQVLVDVDHSMRVMTEESFGPVIGIMRVTSDDEGIRLMNDSDLGLTASVWTSDVDAAKSLSGRLAVGTVFLNRCDYLDPDLAWTGQKNSGRGYSLSRLGYEQLTQAKSLNFKLAP